MMERMNFIYFALGAGSLFVGLLIQPYMKMGWKWIKSLFSPKKIEFTNNKPYPLLQLEIEQNAKKIKELKEQLDNVAETLAIRDRNRKYNLRRDVREYLAELRNDK